jgi:HK97 family phage prohead protease
MQGGISKQYEIKSSTINNTYFEGYASVFGVIDHHNDVVVKGAFKSSLDKKIKLLWQHDIQKPIGIVVKLYEDDFGLKIEGEINNKITAGLEASELIRQKAIDGLSIGFAIKSSEYNQKGQRVITDIDLLEISIVTFPANSEAQIINLKAKNTLKQINYIASLKKLEILSKRLINIF